MTVRSPTRRRHPHLYRQIRDGHGRAIGGCCQECGELIAYPNLGRDDLWLLEACSLVMLRLEDEGEVELTAQARRTLQARRRKLTRLRNRRKLAAELRRQEADDG